MQSVQVKWCQDKLLVCAPEDKKNYEGCLSIWKGRAAEKAKAMGCCEGTPCNNNCPRFGVEE